jgi:hypothetical protein
MGGGLFSIRGSIVATITKVYSFTPEIDDSLLFSLANAFN